MTAYTEQNFNALLDRFRVVEKERDSAVRERDRIREEMAASNEMFLRLMEENVRLKKITNPTKQ